MAKGLLAIPGRYSQKFASVREKEWGRGQERVRMKGREGKREGERKGKERRKVGSLLAILRNIPEFR